MANGSVGAGRDAGSSDEEGDGAAADADAAEGAEGGETGKKPLNAVEAAIVIQNQHAQNERESDAGVIRQSSKERTVLEGGEASAAVAHGLSAASSAEGVVHDIYAESVASGSASGVGSTAKKS